MKRLFSILVLGLLLVPTMAFESSEKAELLEIAEVLKQVESNDNPQAIGDGGLAFGNLQIHEACVLDVNKHYGTTYTHDDAKNPIIAQDIFVKYLSLGIKLYKLRCGFPPNEDAIVRMWNGGIYRGYEYSDTIPYLEKYKDYKAKA